MWMRRNVLIVQAMWKKLEGVNMKIKHIGYRTRQGILSGVMGIASSKKQMKIKGVGSIQKLPEQIKKDGISNILLVTTAGFISRGSLEPFMNQCKENQIRFTIFSDVTPDPTVECVEQAVLVYQKEKCDGIVAIGGGSVMVCAKIVGARIVRPERTIKTDAGYYESWT